MKIIVGLGNPGEVYANTRHNAGILLVDFLSQQLRGDYGWRTHKEARVFETPEILLAKTNGRFMNESGLWVKQVVNNNPEPELWVAHDDLDIRLGEFKIQRGVGPKVHHGLNSVEQVLGTTDFWRIRIGVDNRVSENRTPGEEYVLQRFTSEERQVLEGVLNEIAQTINR